MTEPAPVYMPAPAAVIPKRALDVGRRLLQLEGEYKGRGRVILEVVFVGEEWWVFVNRPGKLERMGNGGLVDIERAFDVK